MQFTFKSIDFKLMAQLTKQFKANEKTILNSLALKQMQIDFKLHGGITCFLIFFYIFRHQDFKLLRHKSLHRSDRFVASFLHFLFRRKGFGQFFNQFLWNLCLLWFIRWSRGFFDEFAFSSQRRIRTCGRRWSGAGSGWWCLVDIWRRRGRRQRSFLFRFDQRLRFRRDRWLFTSCRSMFRWLVEVGKQFFRCWKIKGINELHHSLKNSVTIEQHLPGVNFFDFVSGQPNDFVDEDGP